MVPMTEPIYRLRSLGQYVKFTGVLLFTALFMLSLYIDPNVDGVFPPIIVGAGIALIASVFFLMPCLLLDRDGIRIQNWFVDRWISWRHYTELDTRFGMHIVSDGHSDPVSSYPGSGGLTRGRERMSSSLLGKSQPKPVYIPLRDAGQSSHQAGLGDASSLIARMGKEFAQAAPDRPRTAIINPLRIGLVIVGAALIVIGIQAIV